MGMTFNTADQGNTGITLSGSLGGSTIPVQGSTVTPQPAASVTPNLFGVSLVDNSGSDSSPSTYVDPYAGTIFGSTAGYNKAVSDYNATKDSTMASINDAIGTGGNKYNSSILDYLDARKQQQNTIDSSSVQNELAREQGQQGILDMVGNGIKSSGTILANKNSGASSAGDAIAHAYGTLGRQQATSVGNQFAQGQDKIATEQNNLILGDETQKRHSQEDKTSTINEIVNSARSQLSALNQAAMYASLPDRVDIESKIAEIKQQALDALTQYDSVLSSGISGQSPMGADAVRAKANSLLTAGTAPASAFDYTTEFPAQFANTGQFASSLPIFIAPKKQQTA